MRITLSQQEAFELSDKFAEVVLGAVMHMHLRVADRLSGSPNATLYARNHSTWPLSGIQDIRRAVASIDDAWDRQRFVQQLSFNFKRRRTEKGVAVKWQDYQAAVLAHRASHEEAA